MKTLTHLIGLGGLMVAASAMGQDANPGIRTSINGVPVQFTDVKPMMVRGRVMVPMRDIFTHLGAKLTWNPAEQVVTARQGENLIWLPIGKTRATVNGTPVMLDQPAQVIGGRTMVPLRFVSESLGAEVMWLKAERLVDITMSSADIHSTIPLKPPTDPPYGVNYLNLEEGDVLPFKLNTAMTSKDAKVGDKFTGTLDSSIYADYRTLPAGMKVEGHVSTVKAKEGTTPGVLGLAFDRLRSPDGRYYKLNGELIGLDEKLVTAKNGRLVARDTTEAKDLKYVGYGAGAGALLAIVTKGNVLTNSLIGAALGFLAGELQNDRNKVNDVTLKEGTAFGVRLNDSVSIRTFDRQ